MRAVACGKTEIGTHLLVVVPYLMTERRSSFRKNCENCSMDGYFHLWWCLKAKCIVLNFDPFISNRIFKKKLQFSKVQ